MDGHTSRAGHPSMVAGGTIAPMVFVKISAAAERTLLQATTAGEMVVGVSQQSQKRAPGLPGSDAAVAAEAGDQVDWYGPGDHCTVIAGDTFGFGANLMCDSVGFAVPVTNGKWSNAISLTAPAAAGQTCEVILTNPRQVAVS